MVLALQTPVSPDAIFGSVGILISAFAALFAACSAKASMAAVAEMKEQRKSEARPVLSVTPLNSSISISWSHQDIHIDRPLSLEFANFGQGAALGLQVEFAISADRQDLKRSADYWMWALRGTGWEIGWKDEAWQFIRPTEHGALVVSGAATLKVLKPIAHLGSGEKLVVPVPPAIVRALFLLALDHYSDSKAAPNVIDGQHGEPPKEIRELIEHFGHFSRRSQNAHIALTVEVSFASAFEPRLYAKALIDTDVKMLVPHLNLDEQGWLLQSQKGPTDPTCLKMIGVWALHQDGVRPTDLVETSASFGFVDTTVYQLGPDAALASPI